MKKQQRNFLIILTIMLGLAFPLINKTQQSFHSDKLLNRFDAGTLTGPRTKINKLTVSINCQLELKGIGTQVPDSSNGFEYHNHNLL